MCNAVLLTVRETADRLRLGRSTIYEFLRSGALPSLKIGNARRIAASDLEAFVQTFRDGSDRRLR